MVEMEEKLTKHMEEQIKRGYLKLAILYMLLEGPSHGYQIIKKIRDITSDLLTPTVGSVYPALKELETKGLIKGEWQQQKRKIKVYEITDKGREVFKQIIEKHFNVASTIRKWVLKQLAPIQFVENGEAVPTLMQAVKIILLDENVTTEEKIEALKNFKERLQRLNKAIDKLVMNIDKKIRSLEKKTES